MKKVSTGVTLSRDFPRRLSAQLDSSQVNSTQSEAPKHSKYASVTKNVNMVEISFQLPKQTTQQEQ